MRAHESKPWKLLATLLCLSVTACATTTAPPSAEPAKPPPLVQEALPPDPPPICSPTCSDGLTKLRATLRTMLMDSGLLPTPASGKRAP